MKAIALVLALGLGTTAMASEKTETIHTTASVSVNSLRCVIEAGGRIPQEQRTFTRLGDQGWRKLTIFHEQEGSIELTHELAQALGCELNRLDQIVEDAHMSFGFVLAAPLTVVKHTSASRLNGHGKCVATYTESLTIDVGQGIELTSQKGELREAQDCL